MRARGIDAYASQLEMSRDEVVAWFTERFGDRFAEYAFASAGNAWVDDALSLRDRSLIVIAALVTLGGLEQRLRPHVRWAIEHGSTREELEALAVLLAGYVGAARVSVALELIRDELDRVGA